MSPDAFLVHLPSKHLVGYPIPKHLFDDLYKGLAEAKFFFIPIVLKDKKPKIYFEKQADPKTPAVCRLFWRSNDVKLYIKHLNALGHHEGEVVGWEATPEAIVNSVISAWSKLPGLTVNIVASAFFDNEFRDIEIFWTTNESFMI